MSAVGRGPASTTRSAAGSVRTGGTLSTLTADERGDLPVFCIGDRVLLEVQTLVGQQGFLGLDETVGSENPAFYETPPLSLLLNGMPDSRAKLPPAVDEIARKELPAAEGDDFDEEFYAENCVFELSAVAADGQGGLVVSHGSSRVFLKHVATSKYLAFTGEGATAQLVLKDPDPATAAPPPRSQLEIQPFFASRARGDHVQFDDYVWLSGAGVETGVHIRRKPVSTPDPAYHGGFVVSIGSQHSGFMMRLFTKHSRANTNLVKGGDTVRLRHLLHSMYLRGEYGSAAIVAGTKNKFGYFFQKSPAGDEGQKVADSDPRRKAWDEVKKDRGAYDEHTVDPPLSFDTKQLLDDITLKLSGDRSGFNGRELRDLFLVEVVTEAEFGRKQGRRWAKRLAGSPLAWTSFVRFRHLCSNRHLSLDKDGLKLVEADGAGRHKDAGDWGTVFRIRSTADRSIEPEVKYNSRMLFMGTGRAGKGPEDAEWMDGKMPVSDKTKVFTKVVNDKDVDHQRDVFVIEKVKQTDAQDLRRLLYMRAALYTFVTSMSWRKGEAKWAQTATHEFDGGYEIVGIEKDGKGWNLDGALRDTTDPSTDETDEAATLVYQRDLIMTVQESLKKLIKYMAGEKVVPDAPVFSSGAFTVAPQKKSQLASTCILDMAMAIALLPGEWLLNGGFPEAWVSDLKTPGSLTFVMVQQLQQTTVLAHRLARLAIFQHEAGAEYVYHSKLVMPLSRQVNWNEGTIANIAEHLHGWDPNKSAKEAVRTMKNLLQGDMIDTFEKGLLTNHFAKVLEGGSVQSTVDKYGFLVNVITNGTHVKKQQRWIMREITDPSNARFLPAPVLRETNAKGTDGRFAKNKIRLPTVKDGNFIGCPVTKSDRKTLWPDDPSMLKKGEVPHYHMLEKDDFVAWANEDPDAAHSPEHQLYYVYCELCSAVSAGKNFFCQFAISKIFSVKHLVSAIFEEELPPKWKALYVNLLINVYISHREHTEVLNRRKIVKYGGGASDPETGELLEAKYLRKELLRKKGSRAQKQLPEHAQDTDCPDGTDIPADGLKIETATQLDQYCLIDFDDEVERISQMTQRGSPLFYKGISTGKPVDADYRDSMIDLIVSSDAELTKDPEKRAVRVAELENIGAGIVWSETFGPDSDRQKERSAACQELRALAVELNGGSEVEVVEAEGKDWVKATPEEVQSKGKKSEGKKSNLVIVKDATGVDLVAKYSDDWKKLKVFMLKMVREMFEQDIQKDRGGIMYAGSRAALVYAVLDLTCQCLRLGLLCDWDIDAMTDKGSKHVRADSMLTWEEASQRVTVCAPILLSKTKTTKTDFKLEAIKKYMEILDWTGVLDNNRRVTRMVNFFHLSLVRTSQVWAEVKTFESSKKSSAGAQDSHHANRAKKLREIKNHQDATRQALKDLLPAASNKKNPGVPEKAIGAILGDVVFRSTEADEYGEKLKTARALLQVLRCEDRELTARCLKLLHRQYTARVDLRNNLRDVAIVNTAEAASLDTVLIELRVYLQPCIDFAFGRIYADPAMEPNAKNDALDYFETATSLVRRWFTSMDAFIPNEDEIPKVTERMDVIYNFYDISLTQNMRHKRTHTDEATGTITTLMDTDVGGSFESLGTAPDAKRAVSESTCAKYVWSKLVDLARLFRQPSVREIEVTDRTPFLKNEGLKTWGKYAGSGKQVPFIRCKVMQYFIASCVNFLDKYARASLENQEEVRDFVLDETTRSALGRKSPMTLFLLELSDPEKLAEGPIVALLMSAIYRNARRAASTLRVREAVVLQTLLHTSVTGDQGGTGVRQLIHRPGQLLIFVELLQTLPVSNPAATGLQVDICSLMFPKKHDDDTDQASSKALSEYYDPLKHMKLIKEFAGVQQRHESEQEGKAAGEKKELFRTWLVDAKNDSTDWSEASGGGKICELMFYHRALLVAGYLCRGTHPRIRAVENTLRPWLSKSAAASDELWQERNSEGEPVGNEETWRASKIRQLGAAENDLDDSDLSRELLLDFVKEEVPNRIVAYKGPALRFMQELFLDSQELQDQQQARRDLRESQKLIKAAAEDDGEDGGGGGGGGGGGDDEDADEDSKAEDSPDKTEVEEEADDDDGNDDDGVPVSQQDAAHTKLFDDYAKLVHTLGERVEKFTKGIKTFAAEIMADSTKKTTWASMPEMWPRAEDYVFPFIRMYFNLMLDTDDDDDEGGDDDDELTEAQLSMFPANIRAMFKCEKEGGTFASALKALNTREFAGWRDAVVRKRNKQILERLAAKLKIKFDANDTDDSLAMAETAKKEKKKKKAKGAGTVAEEPKRESWKEQLEAWEKNPIQLKRKWREFLNVIPRLDVTFAVPGDDAEDEDERKPGEYLHLVSAFRILVEEAMGYGELDKIENSMDVLTFEQGFKKEAAVLIIKRLFQYLNVDSRLGEDTEAPPVVHNVQLRTIKIVGDLLKEGTWDEHSIMDKARDINFFDRQDVQSDHQEHLDAVAKLLGGNGAVQLVVNNLALARHEHVLQYDAKVELLAATTRLGKLISDKCNRNVQKAFMTFIRGANEKRQDGRFFLNGVSVVLTHHTDKIADTESDDIKEIELSSKDTTMILNLLQNLCDGQNAAMQNLMHEQPGFPEPIDVLMQVTDCLSRVCNAFHSSYGTRSANFFEKEKDSYYYNYRGVRLAPNELIPGREKSLRRSLISWRSYDKDDVRKQTILMQAMTSFYTTITDFFEGPNRKLLKTLRSTRVGLMSKQLLPYLGSRLLPSNAMAIIGYDGSDLDAKPLVLRSIALSGSKLKNKVREEGQPSGRKSHRQQVGIGAAGAVGALTGCPIEIPDIVIKRWGPIWLDDPITCVAFECGWKDMVDRAKKAFEKKDAELLAKMREENNLTNDLAVSTAFFRSLEEKGDTKVAADYKANLVKAAKKALVDGAAKAQDNYNVWKARIGPQKNINQMLREFARLEMAILDMTQRMLEGKQTRDTNKYLATQFNTKNDAILVNMSFHMLHSQLKYRHSIGKLEASADAENDADEEDRDGSVTVENPMMGADGEDDDDQVGNADEEDGGDEDNGDTKEVAVKTTKQKSYSQWQAWLRTQNFKRKAKAYSRGFLSPGFHQSFEATTRFHTLDSANYRLKYFVLAEAMGQGNDRFRDKLKWFQSFESNKLLTQSFVARDGRRPDGESLGLAPLAIPPRRIIAGFCSVELQRQVNKADSRNDTELEKIYFLKPPLFERFQEITQREKMTMQKDWCGSNNLEEQLQTFITESKTLIKQVEHRQAQVNKIRKIQLLQKLLLSESGVGWAAFLVSVFINVILTMSFRYSGRHPVEVDKAEFGTESWLDALAFLHSFLSFISLVQFYVLRGGYKVTSAMAQKEDDEYRLKMFSSCNFEPKIGEQAWKAWYVLSSPFQSFEALYISTYTAASFWGALGSQQHKFIFAGHLLDVCRRAQVLSTVISVVSSKAEQLLVTLGLGVVVVYLYSVVGFLFLHEQYEVDGKIGCNWLYECLLIHLDYGFRSAPSYVGAGAPLQCTGDNEYPECGYSLVENVSPFLFDFTYYLLVILILVAIITGIVIDSFASQREDDEQKTDHLHNRCFLCGKGRGEFENLGINFEEHQAKHHHIWNYFAFLMALHVRRDDEEDFMASEYHVWEQYKKGTIEFFPMQRSIEIEKLKSKDEDGLASLKKKLEKVEATTKAMKKTQEAAKKSQDELLALVKKMAGTVDAVKANVTAGAQTIRDDESVGASSVGFRSESVY